MSAGRRIGVRGETGGVFAKRRVGLLFWDWTVRHLKHLRGETGRRVGAVLMKASAARVDEGSPKAPKARPDESPGWSEAEPQEPDLRADER